MTHKTISKDDLHKMNWRGLKPLLKAPLFFRPLNYLIVNIISHISSGSRWIYSIPVIKPFIEYNMMSGKVIKMLDPHDCDVARDIFWAKGRRRSSADQLVIESVEILCKGAKSFIDIGAYSGLFAMVASQSDEQIKTYAYEILPQNYILLIRNVIANDLIDRVTPKLMGLGAKNSKITMPLETGLTRLPSSLSLGSSFSEGVSIPVDTLDLESQNFKSPCVIKIDVEGFESEVLSGGKKFLSKIKPDIICEILTSTDDVNEIERLLKPLGYHFWIYTDNGLIEKERLVPTKLGRDWLFTTRQDMSDLPLKS